jgi:DNA polymerase-4
VGSLADWLRRLADGVDDRPVTPNREIKSSGSENTYARDITDAAVARAEVVRLAAASARWLARRQLSARTVVVKVRYGDFTTVTRRLTAWAACDEPTIVERAVRLLDRTEAGRRPVRLLGVSVQNFTNGEDDTSLPFGENP